MGAGIVECDVTFTGDGELVCRHSECDLHTTTNIVATELNAKCTVPWSGPDQAPKPKCCTSDVSLGEFKSLEAKMDASNPAAATAEAYLGGTASWRTDLYTGRARVLTFRESIELNQEMEVKHTPELKGAEHQDRVDAIFGSQAGYAQKFIDEMRNAGVDPKDAWVQSFNRDDVSYWIKHEPAFGKQAVYLDDAEAVADLPSAAELRGYKAEGINIVAPPTFALLAADGNNIVASQYAKDVKAAGLGIITWTLERSGILADGNNGFYYQSFDSAITREGDMLRVLDVLNKQVGIIGIFSDWPATTTFYANCAGLR